MKKFYVMAMLNLLSYITIITAVYNSIHDLKQFLPLFISITYISALSSTSVLVIGWLSIHRNEK
jgi:hypothetical protein